ncbi:MAG TPA: hypothetical protein VNU68_35005 [Verrucomicrobiae bacterium]|nr:hypothetical protein [Verrucomicrobiae bacterium]
MIDRSIHIHLPGVTTIDLCGPLACPVLSEILATVKRIETMSGTLAEQLAAAQAETNAKLDAIGTDVTEISADVDRLLASMTPGTTITQEMVDAANSINTRVGAVKDGLDAINAKS